MTARAPAPETLLVHTDWMRRLARSLVRDDAQADDVVQDAMAAALRSPPRDPVALPAWLAATVRNAARQVWRGESRRAARETACAKPESQPATAEVVARAEEHGLVVQAVLALEEPYRSAVLLRFFDDLPPRDVASRTGVPVETARARIRRGIDQLRGRLDRAHGGDGRAWRLALVPLTLDRAGAATAGTGASATGTHLTTGALTMASGGVTAAVGAIALLAGIAVGWWTGATKSDQVAVDLTKQVDTARAAKESAESEKETLRQTISRLEASLREAQTKLRDAEKDAASLREQLAAKPSPAVPATPAETATAKGPRFTFDEFSKLADVDWKSVGEHLSALAPLCDEIATALAKGEDLPPETTGKASQHNGFLITAALKIAGQVPGSNPNASYTNPAFMLNAIAATLESAGKPLTAEQATSLEKRARELTEEDVRRRQGYDASTYALQKVIEETELRRRFFDFAFKTLTPAQGAALTPPSARGLLGFDFFSESLVWVASVRPVTFKDVPSLVDSVSSIVQSALHVPKERWDDLHAVVDHWAHDLPPELTDPNSEDRARGGHVSSSNLRLASSATLTLLQKSIADLKLDGDSVAAARKWQGILLLMPSRE